MEAIQLIYSVFSPLLTPDEGPSLETSIFSLSFQALREPLPFAYLPLTLPLTQPIPNPNLIFAHVEHGIITHFLTNKNAIN